MILIKHLLTIESHLNCAICRAVHIALKPVQAFFHGMGSITGRDC